MRTLHPKMLLFYAHDMELYKIYNGIYLSENITIFGESAGSFSVDALIRSDLAVPYFHRAIGQSGLLISTWCAQTQDKL